jgi:hypothetical protein
LFNSALDYLNTYIQPHNFIGISIFEDDHPCPSQFYHVVIIHKAVDDTIPMKKSEDIKGNIYKLEILESKSEDDE